jgi:predicted protein tyrosine phosphatase
MTGIRSFRALLAHGFPHRYRGIESHGKTASAASPVPQVTTGSAQAGTFGVIWTNQQSRIGMLKILFVCSLCRLRSPTAERVFANRPGCDVASAGIADGADDPVTPEALDWADLIFAMEEVHRRKLVEKFSSRLKDKRVITLDIPDKYDFMDPRLVRLLKKKVVKHLPPHRLQ